MQHHPIPPDRQLGFGSNKKNVLPYRNSLLHFLKQKEIPVIFSTLFITCDNNNVSFSYTLTYSISMLFQTNTDLIWHLPTHTAWQWHTFIFEKCNTAKAFYDTPVKDVLVVVVVTALGEDKKNSFNQTLAEKISKRVAFQSDKNNVLQLKCWLQSFHLPTHTLPQVCLLV